MKNAVAVGPPRSCKPILEMTLDDVDLGRQVRGNLEADFLLANGGLGPDFHDFLPPSRSGWIAELDDGVIGHPPDHCKSQVRDLLKILSYRTKKEA
jgi:hypothetical protein